MSQVSFVSRFDLVRLAKEHRRLLAILASVGALVGVAYTRLAPKWYEATLTVVPAQRSVLPGAGLAAALPGLSGLASPFATDVDRIDAVLATNAVADEVIGKFGLMRRYDVTHIEDARRLLRKYCTTSSTRRAGVVTLTCEDGDPKRARDLAAAFGEVGNRVFRQISGGAAGEEKQFLETRVAQAHADLTEASRRVREFQERHRIIDITEQSRAVISAMAQIQADLITKQVQLSYLAGFSSSTEGSVVQLRQQIAILKQKLADMESARAADKGTEGPAVAASGSTFFPSAMSVPELRFELEPLMRQQKVQEAVVVLLTQRYESAKVDAARDTSTFQVLDPPTIATLPAGPRLRVTVPIAVAVSLALGLLWVMRSALRPSRVSTGTAAPVGASKDLI